jgi:hypothetical protein
MSELKHMHCKHIGLCCNHWRPYYATIKYQILFFNRIHSVNNNDETNIFHTFIFFLLDLIHSRAKRWMEGHLMGTEGKMISVLKEYWISEFKFYEKPRSKYALRHKQLYD